MKYLGAVGFAALGLYGLHEHIEYSGWLIALAFLVVL